MFADGYGVTKQQTEDGSVIRPTTAISATSLRELDINAMNNITTESNNASMKDVALSEKDSSSTQRFSGEQDSVQVAQTTYHHGGQQLVDGQQREASGQGESNDAESEHECFRYRNVL